MKQDSLTRFIENLRQARGPLNSALLANCQAQLEELAKASIEEPWLASLQQTLSEHQELYRDPDFILLAHKEQKGLYRPPHDHGEGWVIYAVQSGEMEMGAYALKRPTITESDLLRREKYRVRKGQSRIYLPGDIHDTRCISDSVLMLRLTNRDLKEEQLSGRMHRYPEPN